MKKLLLGFLALSSTSLFAQTDASAKKADQIAKFNVETVDFGKIKQNVPATATVVVTNIGTEPLIIEQASPSCGCTVSDYTKAPIAPGKTGKISATFNAAAVGPINKSITVKFAGADDVKFIKLTGEVLAAAPASNPPAAATTTTDKKVKKVAKS
ncbi:MAG TPA: DUF1573 domain-containing protein [Hanamia sp.]|jgi:Protein of unknown function (DUF1573)|nr:DUF1573 domain-containing protein [Hanamia sp.]